MAYDRRTSIHGRRLALSSTNAIVDGNGYGAVMKNSTGAIQSSSSSLTFAGSITASENFISGVETVSSSGATISPIVAVSVLSSATATSRNFSVGTPVAGHLKEILSVSSATTILLESTVASILFVTTGTSSSALTFSLAGGSFGQAILLRGISATRWVVVNKSGAVL